MALLKIEQKAAVRGIGGIFMKRFAFAILMIGALMMVSSTSAKTGRVADSKIQQDVVEFDTQVKLLNVILKGQYLFVHDEERMARGESCTYVYKYADGKKGELVVSFHCIPVAREKTNHFTITTRKLPNIDLYELVEYRLAGSSEGHRVPTEK
jgi:hypothetical protein